MDSLRELTGLLDARRDLASEQATAAAEALADPHADPNAKKDFLLALARKGENATEVAAFAALFRERAIDPGLGPLAADAIDIVGTGGDRSGSFNISTATAFIVAAGEVPVLKHGNRSVTSKCGSADILEALGIPLAAEPATLRASLERTGFAFLFAPAFHPAFKAIVPVRKALAEEGHRTVFNILGPLINPARPPHTLLGCFEADWVEPLGRALDTLGCRGGLVVCGTTETGAAMDELTCAGDNTVHGLGRARALTGTLSPEDCGLPRCRAADLAGGSLPDNLALLEKILAAKGPPGLRDTLALNAGAAFVCAGRCQTLEEGILFARELLDGGEVADWLRQTRSFHAS